MIYRWCILACSALLLILSVLAGDECPSSSPPPSATSALKKQLLCGYDHYMRPVKEQTSATNVSYSLVVFFFLFYEEYNRMDIHGWSFLSWKDEFLAWNASDHSNVKELLLRRKDIWVPDIDISTFAHHMVAGNSHSPDVDCKVSMEGVVSCSLPTVYNAHCNPDIQRWPFDSHNCTMRVSTFSNSVDEVNLTLSGKQGVVTIIKSDRYWKLVNSSAFLYTINDGKLKWSEIVYSFLFERHSGFLMASYFIPSIVMMLATLSTFCLDPLGFARVFIIGSNIIIHCLFLMYLGWLLPANGDRTPIAVVFMRDSLLLVVCSLLITICSGRLKAAARAPPSWVCALTDGVLDTPGANYILFTGLYAQSDMGEEEESTAAETFETLAASTARLKWQHLAVILDRVSLLVFAITLVALSSAFIP